LILASLDVLQSADVQYMHPSLRMQRRMRHKNIEKQVLEKQLALVLKQQKAAMILLANTACEERLLSSMKVQLQSQVDVPPKSIQEATLTDFDNCTAPLLKVFIHVRMFDKLLCKNV
jgi:hypothetical protein